MTTATDRLTAMTQALKAGLDVYVCTYTKTTKITQRNFAAWEKSGHSLLKVAGNSLYMARGKKFDCIDFCKIVIQ